MVEAADQKRRTIRLWVVACLLGFVAVDVMPVLTALVIVGVIVVGLAAHFRGVRSRILAVGLGLVVPTSIYFALAAVQ